MTSVSVSSGDDGNRCTFCATDGRRCILSQWHKAPRARQGHYVTYGDLGDAHLLEGEQSCKWGNGPRPVPGEVLR